MNDSPPFQVAGGVSNLGGLRRRLPAHGCWMEAIFHPENGSKPHPSLSQTPEKPQRKHLEDSYDTLEQKLASIWKSWDTDVIVVDGLIIGMMAFKEFTLNVQAKSRWRSNSERRSGK